MAQYHMIRDNAVKLRELRKLVREYISAMVDVPKRAVDCDQEVVLNLERKLGKLVRWKDPYANIRAKTQRR